MAVEGNSIGAGEERPIGDLVNRISENASVLIREEIELAKAEIEEKVKRIARGAVAGAVAGFFVFMALIMLSWKRAPGESTTLSTVSGSAS